MIQQWRPSRTHHLHPQVIWVKGILIRRWIWMAMARLLRPQVIWLTVAWAPWVTHLADRLMLVLLRRCPMRRMLLLALRWMALWIKAVRPHRQIRQELRPIRMRACQLKTMVQR